MTTKTMFCPFCEQTLPITQFYTSKNEDRYPPDGHLPLCKSCVTFGIDHKDPSTFLHVMKAVDVPYIEEEWNNLYERYKDRITSSTSIMGRYLSKMKLCSFKGYRFSDTEWLNKKRGEANG